MQTTSGVVTAQASIAQVIAKTSKESEDKGNLLVSWVVTPNHAWTDFIVKVLTHDIGIEEDEIACISLNFMDAQLECLGVDKEKLRSMTSQEQLHELEQRFSTDVQSRRASYVIGDIEREVVAGKLSDPGMANLRERHEAKHGSAPKDGRIHLVLWVVGFERMDVVKLQQMLDRLSPFAESNGMSAEAIEITSLESARQDERLRSAAEKNSGWSIDVIVNSLRATTMRFGTGSVSLHSK